MVISRSDLSLLQDILQFSPFRLKINKIPHTLCVRHIIYLHVRFNAGLKTCLVNNHRVNMCINCTKKKYQTVVSRIRYVKRAFPPTIYHYRCSSLHYTTYCLCAFNSQLSQHKWLLMCFATCLCMYRRIS